MTTAGGPRFDARALGRAYGVPAIAQQRVRSRELLGARPGETVLDLGCGPGHLAADPAAAARVVWHSDDHDRTDRVLRLWEGHSRTEFFSLTRFATVVTRA